MNTIGSLRNDITWCVYHLCNELNPNFTFEDGKKMEHDMIYLPSCTGREYKTVFHNFLSGMSGFMTNDWFSKKMNSFTGLKSECTHIRVLMTIALCVEPQLFQTFATSPMVILSVNLDRALDGVKSAINVLDTMAIYSPTLQWLAIIYSNVFIVRSKVHTCLETLRIMGALYPKDVIHLGWGHFFGFSGKQSYERAITYGVPIDICTPSVDNAAKCLDVPIGLMYKYFDNFNFLRTLRLVCKLWNATITRYNNFWPNGTYENSIQIHGDRRFRYVRSKKIAISRIRGPRNAQIQKMREKVAILEAQKMREKAAILEAQKRALDALEVCEQHDAREMEKFEKELPFLKKRIKRGRS